MHVYSEIHENHVWDVLLIIRLDEKSRFGMRFNIKSIKIVLWVLIIAYGLLVITHCY